MRQVRNYSFSAIENFRDFGGVAGLPAGRLFRSAHIGRATVDDIRQLKRLNLSAIIDLRRPSERVNRPTPQTLSVPIIDNAIGDRAESPHLEFLRQGDISDAGVERYLLQFYRTAPFQPRHLDLFSRAFAAHLSGPILIHCAAGKDRTGLLAALIQYDHGVHRDDIVADFLSTNDRMMSEGRIQRTQQFARDLIGSEPSTAVIRAILGVEERHLDAAFESIREQKGSVEAYLSDVKQITSASDALTAGNG